MKIRRGKAELGDKGNINQRTKKKEKKWRTEREGKGETGKQIRGR